MGIENRKKFTLVCENVYDYNIIWLGKIFIKFLIFGTWPIIIGTKNRRILCVKIICNLKSTYTEFVRLWRKKIVKVLFLVHVSQETKLRSQKSQQNMQYDKNWSFVKVLYCFDTNTIKLVLDTYSDSWMDAIKFFFFIRHHPDNATLACYLLAIGIVDDVYSAFRVTDESDDPKQA